MQAARVRALMAPSCKSAAARELDAPTRLSDHFVRCRERRGAMTALSASARDLVANRQTRIAAGMHDTSGTACR
jgi:hypothetical protein